MGGHSTGRHAGEWDNNSQADDQASASQLQGAAGFDQWLGHLTYRQPNDPADPPFTGARPAGPEPAADPSMSSGAWPPPAFPGPGYDTAPAFPEAGYDVAPALPGPGYDVAPAFPGAGYDVAPAFPEAGNGMPSGAWSTASPEAGGDVLSGTWASAFPEAGNDARSGAWASTSPEARNDLSSGGWPLAAPVAGADVESTAWGPAFSEAGSDVSSGGWPLAAPVADTDLPSTARGSAFFEAGSDVPSGAWPLAAPEGGNEVASAAWASAFAEPGNEEHGKGGGGRRGFLGSGWYDDEPEPRPRRFRRLAILSSVTVLLAAGVTFAGIRLVGNETTLAIEPPGSGCASTNSCGAAPAMDMITPTSAPTDSPTETDSATDPGVAPSATPTTTPEAAKPTPSAVTPTPVPKTKKTPTATPSKKPPVSVDDEPTQDSGSDGVIEDPGTTTDEAAPDQGDIRVAEAPQVAVGFEVLRQDDIGYTARIVVRNEGAELSGGWTLEFPVGGEVTAVDGVQWEQRGGTLVITPEASLAAGEELTITFDANGTAEQPSDCTLSEGECRLSAV